LKGEVTVSEKTATSKVAAKAASLGISLDAWAVVLALGLALLVWLGWIKQVSW
jgi:disulfide bond formation protein DsbB